MKKILFISHETSRSGAPIILLNFIKWLKKNKPAINVDVLVLRGGELKNEFEEVADHFYDIPKPPGIIKKLFFRIFKSGIVGNTDYNRFKKVKVKVKDYDLIYANSLLSIHFAAELSKSSDSPKLVAHLHELETVIELILPDLKEYLKDFHSIIVPANIVKENLILNHDVPAEKIEVIREFSQVAENGSAVKSRTNKFVVGASGTVHWRKGPDIFILVAAYLKKNYPDYPIEFKWVGRLPDFQKSILNSDIRKLGISDYVNFTGERSVPIDEYKTFDIFLLPSREDPFPLVCIEVGIMGKPVICFKKATGTSEIIEKGGGSIVDYLDAEAMAEKVIDYYRNPKLLENHGREAQELFSDFTPEKVCPEIFQILKETE